MALVTKASDASMDTASILYAPQRPGLTAGEALDALAPCYIKQSDGLVYMSNGTAANEEASFDGMTPRAYALGDSNVTLFGLGTKLRYATGLTPGAMLYIGATAGRLDTAPTAGDGAGVARVISATLIRIVRDFANGAGGITDLSVGTADIAAGALAASAAGRAIIADDYFNAATADDKFAAGAIGEDLLTAGELTGRVMANVADANVIGGIPVIFRIDVAAGVTGDVDVVSTHKIRVINVWLVKRAAAGGGAGTITVKNGATAITDAMSIDINDKAIARAATIDDAQHEIAAAGTLRVTRTRTASTDETCTVYVEAVRVA